MTRWRVAPTRDDDETSARPPRVGVDGLMMTSLSGRPGPCRCTGVLSRMSRVIIRHWWPGLIGVDLPDGVVLSAWARAPVVQAP